MSHTHRLAVLKITLVVAMVTLGFAALVPAGASASTGCATGQSPWTFTRGGYQVKIDRYRDVHGMACTSVRYVINRWLRHKIARQYGWPHIGGPFWDGYVTWHCFKTRRYYWRCEEYTSDTVFSFRGIVYD
jgi:hypothetical protein